jgi:hypothetical protein
MKVQSGDGVRALLRSIVDYAGLFPPAQLDMATTLGNYDAYLSGGDSWMLGRLVVPVSRLDEFEMLVAGRLPLAEGEPAWQLTGLTAPASDPELPAHLERIAAFNRTHLAPSAGLAAINSIELKASGVRAIESALDLVPDELFPFFELPDDRDPRGLIAAIAGSDAGMKVRTGGSSPRSVPAPQRLARLIAGAAAAEVPFKATAGLHHPLRHRSEAIGADEFGFLNVFAAGVVAMAKRPGEAALVEILSATEASQFKFGARGMDACGHKVPLDEIEEARAKFAISFGSCSFEEPRDHLRAMKLI